jgi:hypothetical protein
MLGLQAVQKPTGVCVNTKPPRTPFSPAVAPFRNRAQIVTPAKQITFANKFVPAYGERHGLIVSFLRRFQPRGVNER